MDEERLFLSIGRIEAKQDDHKEYLDSVYMNVKEIRKELADHMKDADNGFRAASEALSAHAIESSKALSAHTESIDAHGGKSRNQVWTTIGKTLAGAASLVAIIYTIIKLSA